MSDNAQSAQESVDAKPYVSYESIGGLKKEIEAVREVVELAVNSPKLFTEYGKLSSLSQNLTAHIS